VEKVEKVEKVDKVEKEEKAEKVAKAPKITALTTRTLLLSLRMSTMSPTFRSKVSLSSRTTTNSQFTLMRQISTTMLRMHSTLSTTLTTKANMTLENLMNSFLVARLIAAMMSLRTRHLCTSGTTWRIHSSYSLKTMRFKSSSTTNN